MQPWAKKPKVPAIRSIVGMAAEGIRDHMRTELPLAALRKAAGSEASACVVALAACGGAHGRTRRMHEHCEDHPAPPEFVFSMIFSYAPATSAFNTCASENPWKVRPHSSVEQLDLLSA